MASIGPQLPPHLLKRKRTPDEEESETDRPSKASKPQNADEIALDDEDDDSDDEYGPSAGPAPSLGPGAAETKSKLIFNEEPKLLLSISTGMNTSQAPKPVMGPAAPPTDLATRPTSHPTADHASASDSDSDDSDDYGPALPSSNLTHASSSSAAVARRTTAAAEANEPAAPQRDAWMLAPPTDTSYRERDPTKLKARKFASGKASSSGGGDEISSIWTETPEAKARRIADKVLGRGDGSGDSASQAQKPLPKSANPTDAARRAAVRDAREGRIQDYTENTRGKSLYEEHQSRRKDSKKTGNRAGKDEEDDPSQRPFDREKDMALGGRINNTQRQDLLKRAGDFGGRFSKGSYL
jgi:hypothetical protein